MMQAPKDYSDPNSFAKLDEHSHQVALMAACAQYAYEYQRLLNTGCVDEQLLAQAREASLLKWFFAVPNGGSRGDSEKSARIQGALMKAEGVKKGVADCLLPVAKHGYHGFFIEMKKPGNKTGQSKEQKEFEVAMMANGYLYAVCDSWWSAFRALMWYLGFEHTRAWYLPE